HGLSFRFVSASAVRVLVITRNIVQRSCILHRLLVARSFFSRRPDEGR
ncbi:unnamed protein product, partial [Amoebophrya sp. A120]